MRTIVIAWVIACSAIACGCRGERGKKCEQELLSAQDVVNGVDAQSVESVEKSLRSVSHAERACEQAGMEGEAAQLRSAQRQLSSHLELLREREVERARRMLSVVDVERLARHGDPGCPRGQAYKAKQSDKEIRCTGPQIVDMSWDKAKEYYSKRGYKVLEEPPKLKAEFGSELFIFTYTSQGDKRPPKCLELYPPPGMSWQEATSRVTSVQPERLKSDGTVRTARGNARLRIEEDENKLIVQIGECG